MRWQASRADPASAEFGSRGTELAIAWAPWKSLRTLLLALALTAGPGAGWAQHALDKLLDPAAPKAAREGRVESSVMDSSRAADGALKAKIDDVDRNLSSLRRSSPPPEAGDQPKASATAKGKPDTTARVKPDTAAKDQPVPTSYACRIYCRSASGPSIEREFRAASRREAARQAGDAADGMCAQAGHGNASARALPESQCWAK